MLLYTPKYHVIPKYCFPRWYRGCFFRVEFGGMVEKFKQGGLWMLMVDHNSRPWDGTADGTGDSRLSSRWYDSAIVMGWWLVMGPAGRIISCRPAKYHPVSMVNTVQSNPIQSKHSFVFFIALENSAPFHLYWENGKGGEWGMGTGQSVYMFIFFGWHAPTHAEKHTPHKPHTAHTAHTTRLMCYLHAPSHVSRGRKFLLL